MRIVGGRFGGRSLRTPATRAIRPTADRLREAIFNRLAHSFDNACDGARVIDLFAGIGALGLEAISRSARFALFVDDGSEARALLRENIETFGLGGVTRIFRRDATKLGDAPPGEKFTLAFLDPPYSKGFAAQALSALSNGGWLAPDALCIIEEAADAAVELPTGFARVDARTYGDTQVVFARSIATDIL